MSTPALPVRLRTLRLPATMPGRLGKPAALLAAIVLFLAALPILTMITMSFSASDTLEFPPLRLQPAVVSGRVAQLRCA